MRERISQLAKGNTENLDITLSLSVTQIEETLSVDDKQRGDFYLSCQEGRTLKGLVYSTNQKVAALNGHFLGSDCRVYYEVDTTGALADICGEFQLVTNAGEFIIPYVFHVVGQGTLGKTFESLEKFAEFAEENEEEALRFFESSRFTKCPFMQDIGRVTVYENIWGKGDRANAMEEFLVSCGVRRPVHFTLEDEEKHYPSLQEAVCDDLIIKRTGKGAMTLRLSTDAPFIRLDSQVVTEKDFDRNTCAVMYSILPARLHSGFNYGTITVSGLYETRTLKLRVSTKPEISWNGGTAYKRDIASFTAMYLKLATGEMEEKLLYNSMQSVLNHSREYAPNDYSVLLYQTDISIRQGKSEQAMALLEQARAAVLGVRDKDVSSYCYYLWLKAKLSQDPAQKQNMVKILRKFYDENVASDMVFFILMLEDPDLKENVSLTLSRLKDHYRKGCNSPYLYMAGCKILQKSPDLMRVMEEFELKCLNFGSRHHMISERLAKQAAELALSVRGNRQLCLNVLKRLYKLYPVKELLTGICALLVRADARDEESFAWYEKGVEEDIRLTRLYEYYLYALPENHEGAFPRMLLLYFALNHELDYRSQASLYLNVLEYMQDDEEIYGAYEGQIEAFAVEQLLQSHMNEKLAKIYKNTIFPGMVDQRIAAILPKLLYAKKITAGVPGMRQVILCYEEVKGETTAPVRDNVAYLPIYMDHAHVLFQDEFGNRYANIPYEVTALMDAPELEACVAQAETPHRMIQLKEGLEILKKPAYNEEDVETLKELSAQEDIRELFRKQLISEIISYYHKEEGLSTCDTYLLTIDKKLLRKEDRLKVMESLISKDFCEEAYQMAARYGYKEISVSGVMKMTSRMILKRLYAQDEFLLELAKYCFEKKRCDEVICEYLCQYYNGLCKNMYAVMAQGKAFKSNLFDLPERLLAQMLFTGSYENMDAVYEIYSRGKGLEILLLHAYLTVKSGLYFEEGAWKEEPFLKDVEEWMQLEVPNALPIPCMLALTAYYSGLSGLKDAQADLCKRMIDSLMRAQIYFGYYRKLARFITMNREFLEDTLIEYHGTPGQKLWIHETLLPSKEKLEELMPHMYEGYYGRRFSLLRGEKMQYEIYEEDAPETILASGVLEKEKAPYTKASALPGSRVDVLNELLEAAEQEDYETWKKKALDYSVRDELLSRIFTVL